MFKKLLALLLFIGLATAQSHICFRTATSDIFCNDNRTRTIVFYSYQPNVLTEAGWQPFEDVAVLEFKDDHFELSYNNQTARIDLFAVVDGKEMDIKDTEVKVEPVIIKQRGAFEYGVKLDGADKMEAFGFRVKGDSIKEVTYDFSDTITENTSLEMVDSKTALVRNVNLSKQLTIDPLIVLNATNSANVGDTEVEADNPTVNHGTDTSMDIRASGAVGGVQRIFNLWNLIAVLPSSGITIVSANYSTYSSSGTGTYSAQLYNTSNSWTETGLTWNNQPAAGTLQDTKTISGVARYSWSVTSAVQSCYAQSNKNCSFMVKHSTEGAVNEWNVFTTKEGTAANAPYLNVTYTTSYTFPETGLAGYWKFDENSGLYVLDYSGNDNIGTLMNSPTWVTGKNYQTPYALSYDGVNQHVTGSFSPTATVMNWTVSAWVYPTTSVGSIVELDNATSNWVVYMDTILKLWNGTADVYNSGTTIPVGSWTHIAIVYNGTHVSGYVNGIFISSTAVASSILETPTSSTFRIGTDRAVTTWFNGTIDEVKIYNRSLSASEIMNESFHYCPLNPISINTVNESLGSGWIYFNLLASNSTSTFSYDLNFSDYSCNSSFPTGATTFAISNSSFYSPRYYYATTTYGGSYGLTAYLLPLSSQYPILTTFYVLYSGQAIPEAEITIQKSIGSTWTTIAQKTTDSAGGASFNLDYSASYYFITNASGYLARYDYLTPTSSIYYLTLSKTSGAYDEWSTYWNQYEYDCVVDNSSYPSSIDINCSVNDTSGLMQYARLRVWEIGNYGNILKCDTNETANATLGCTITNAGNKTYQYTLVAHFQKELLLSQRIVQFFDSSAFKSVGAMPAMLITLTCGLVGIWNPALGIIGLVAGLGATSILGLLELTIEGWVAIAIVGVILVYELRS
jgi:hypothetical protein